METDPIAACFQLVPKINDTPNGNTILQWNEIVFYMSQHLHKHDTYTYARIYMYLLKYMYVYIKDVSWIRASYIDLQEH